ncbi:outer membrane beta-barrel protein [Hydrogenophaga palleronii]|uniref:outer membrane beta-barrel protein n=1 Tax=Hydrogenophaga palleronii TaxID=65655 RepID=UPI0008254B74|nr:outer membrane beta-barrel protein [Hydrogenophaga palleronii]
MKHLFHPLKIAAVASLGLAFACGASAQSSASSGYSVIPYSHSGYIGINVGQPDYENSCGLGGFSCSDNTTSAYLYTGGMFNPYFGAEIGYVSLGKAKRGGGRTEAQGINLSLVGRLPLGGSRVSLFGKVGTVYGRTEVTASALSGIPTGKASGWEASYGAGVGFDLSPRSSIVLEWARYDLRFAGVGKRQVDTTSIGYVHRF